MLSPLMVGENSLKHLENSPLQRLPETVPVITRNDKNMFKKHKSKTADDYVSYQMFAIPYLCEWLQIILFSSEVQWIVIIRSDEFKNYFGLKDKPAYYFDSSLFVIVLFYIGVIAGCMLVNVIPIYNWRHKVLFSQAIYSFTLVPMVFSGHSVLLFAVGRLLSGISAGLSLVSLSYFNQQLLVNIRYTTVKFLATYLFTPAAAGWLALGHYCPGSLWLLSCELFFTMLLTGLTYLLPNSVLSTLGSNKYISEKTKELFQNSYCRFKGSKRYRLSADEIPIYIGHYYHYFKQERIQKETLFKKWTNKLSLYLVCGVILLYIEWTTCVVLLMLYYPLVIVEWNPYHTIALYVAMAMFGLSLIGSFLWKANHRVPYSFLFSFGTRLPAYFCSISPAEDKSMDRMMIIIACFSLPLQLLSSLTYPYAAVLDNFPEHIRYQTVFIIKAVVSLFLSHISAVFTRDSYVVVLLLRSLDSAAAMTFTVFLALGAFGYWLEKAYFGKYEILPRDFLILNTATIIRRGLESSK